MKNLIFYCAILLCFISACKKSVVSPISGIYIGQVKQTYRLRLDSFPVKLKLDVTKGQFSYLPNGCKGDFEIKSNKIIFNSQDCACWCNCCKSCDCGGDFILSEFDFIVENNHVIFTRSYGNMSIDAGVTITFDLKKE